MSQNQGHWKKKEKRNETELECLSPHFQSQAMNEVYQIGAYHLSIMQDLSLIGL